MSLRTNIAASWGAHLVTLLVGVFLVPFVLERMGEEGYGVWVFVNSIAGYSGVLYLGFGPTVCRYVADHRARGEWEQVNRVVSSVVAVYFVAGGMVMLLAGGFAMAAAWIDKWGSLPLYEVQLAILILGLNMGAGMVGSVYGGILFAAQRFDLVSSVQGATALIRLGLTVLFLQQMHGLLTLAAIFLTVTLIENGLTAWLAYRQTPTLSVRRRWVTRNVLKECFGFSAFTALRWISGRLIYLTDTVVIGFVLGPTAIVPYYIGSRLVQMVHTPLEKIADVVLPSAGELHARGDREKLQALLAKGMGLAFLLAGGFWIGSAYFGERLLVAWMGETYSESRVVLLILLAAQVVAQPMIVARQVLLAMGRVRLQALLDVTEALANLGLSLVLVHAMGIIGVAWGTLIPMVTIEIALLLPYSLRAIGAPAVPVLRQTLVPALLPLSLLWAYCEAVSRVDLPAGWLAILAITAGGGIVLGLSRVAWDYLARLSQRDALSGRALAGSEAAT
jgi:O-antigen/teichoic acid export membrane protein